VRRGLQWRLRHLRPFPLVWLTLVWILLWGTWSVGNVVNGLLLSALALTVLPLPEVAIGGKLHLRSLARFAGRFGFDLVASSVLVAWQAVRPGPQAVSSVVAVQLRSDSEMLMTLTTEALTLVPGSIVLEVDVRTRTIYAHVLDAPDEAAVEAFRRRVLALETRIIRAVGRSADLELLQPTGRASAPGGGR
jgi:multicomponent Na+:H+ antiporter subunit E